MKRMLNLVVFMFLLFLFINVESTSAECTYTYLGTHFKNLKDYPFGELEVNPAGDGAKLSFDVSNKKGKVTKRADYKILFFDSSWSFGDESTIKSWGKDYCPMYITVNNNDESDWRAFDEKPDPNKIYGDLNSGRISVFMNDNPELPTYECTYDGFKIKFLYDGKALVVESTMGNTFQYDLDESLTEQPAVQPGVCENVHTCLTTSIPPLNGSPGIQGYTVFSGSIDLATKQSSVCLNSIMTLFEYKIDEEISNESGNNSACRSFESKWRLLEDYYSMCLQNNITYCQVYNEYKFNIKNWCNIVTEYVNYNDACLNKCFNFRREISELENKEFVNSQCGFSGRLILFIANIISWIKYIIPVAVIILGTLDFIKAIGVEKEDEMKKAQQRFIKRLIAAALIFIIPFILEFVLNKMGFDAMGCGIINL